MNVDGLPKGLPENLRKPLLKEKKTDEDDRNASQDSPLDGIFRKSRGRKARPENQIEHPVEPEIGGADCRAHSPRPQEQGSHAGMPGIQGRKHELGDSHRQDHPQDDQGRLLLKGDAEEASHGKGHQGSDGKSQKGPKSGGRFRGGRKGRGPEVIDHAARRQEGVRLVHGMGNDVHHRQAIEPQTAFHHHEPHLGTGRIGERLLDVRLHHHHQGGHRDREKSGQDHRLPGPSRHREDRAHPKGQKGPGVDDAGMQKRGDRGRGLHHLDQPSLQGELGTLEDDRQREKSCGQDKGLRECPIQGANRRSNPGKVRRVQGADDENDRPQ